LWQPLSPANFLERVRDRQTLLVYARYDLTFPVALSRRLVNDFRRMGLPHEVAVLPCGHYSTGLSPFKWLDGYLLTRFLRTALRAA
jgi:predicted esterase